MSRTGGKQESLGRFEAASGRLRDRPAEDTWRGTIVLLLLAASALDDAYEDVLFQDIRAVLVTAKPIGFRC